jgi:hypothetical protein
LPLKRRATDQAHERFALFQVVPRAPHSLPARQLTNPPSRLMEVWREIDIAVAAVQSSGSASNGWMVSAPRECEIWWEIDIAAASAKGRAVLVQSRRADLRLN